jgi:hypothetical protein
MSDGETPAVCDSEALLQADHLFVERSAIALGKLEMRERCAAASRSRFCVQNGDRFLFDLFTGGRALFYKKINRT